MFEKYMIVTDNVKNVVNKNGKANGFQIGARLPYYRGVSLSMVQEIEVTVNGKVVPQNKVDITVHDNTYNLEQRENETEDRWEMGEVATLTVHKTGGLSAGEHEIGLKINLRIGYMPFSEYQSSGAKNPHKLNRMNTDVLIIGSGPIGATYARIIAEQKPDAKILMIDLGPRLTDKAGQHTKNISNPADMEAALIKSQGNKQTAYPPISVPQRALAVQKGELTADILARAGTHLATDQPEDLAKNQMPAAAMSSNVGGMGSHWTCACPTPGNAERIPFIPEAEYEAAFAKAKELLCVTQNAFPETPESLAIMKTLGSVFNEKLGKDRQVQPMPLACKVNENGERYWTGADLILGEMAAPQPQKGESSFPNFELRSETLCRRLFTEGVQNDSKPKTQNSKLENTEGGKITGALIEHLPTGKQEEIHAKIVIVACDALRTPQLLWASGIRPKALGHYLNEHPFIFTFVELKEDLVDKICRDAMHRVSTYNPNSRTEPTIGVFWVPFDAPHHPFHGQIMHMDLSPMKTTIAPPLGAGGAKHIVGLGWGCLKSVQYKDRIVFSKTKTDYLGMPKMNFKFQYTEGDKKNIEDAKKMQLQAAEAFGKVIKDGDQTVMPAGTSLHYQGTTRMGETNDGTSVCDTYSQVWGFDNLFVGGNGVIPMSTTSNPTLTSVAMAVRACEKIKTYLHQLY